MKQYFFAAGEWKMNQKTGPDMPLKQNRMFDASGCGPGPPYCF